MTTNNQLQQRKQAVIARGQGNVYPVYVAKAKNAEVWDVEGKRYIDLGTGIAVCNTGHSHPAVVAAATKQLQEFSHTCVMVNPYEVAIELAEKLTTLAPGNTPKKAVFVSTGAEAVENCVKIARSATGRRGVIAFTGGFHGRTNLAMGLTGKNAPYKSGFGPFPGDIYHVPFPNEAHGVTVAETLGFLKHLFKASIEPSDVAAIIVEPVQGEGGFYMASPEFLQALRALCDEHGMLLILDEIQTGFGRTGRMFCAEYSDVEADLMTMAKGIAGGLPLAAVVGKAEIMDAAHPGGLGGTYGGSPVACAAALAVLQVIEEEQLVSRASWVGEKFSTVLHELQQEFPSLILEVRQVGAMIALELVVDGDAAQPNAALVQRIISLAPEYGLILLACGYYGNVIRFLPALTIEEPILDEALERFETLFRHAVE
ncbi:4-aminobutyrate--2-oxoglutarate transaminase [Pseudidiomarina marina]|uniref:4-aminobutyrate--2-oxoglutarate transaminase n=1 Tax=Pseudidiomarina marina TaxID=502366 RepID=UPI003850269B